jgi:uncharacterized protein (TIGR03086 family)
VIRVTGASVEGLVRACEAVGDLISRVGPDQWDAPTPCSEWNVRDVVNHVVEGNQVFVALVDGGPMPERGTDHLGDDPAGAYRASAAVLRDAFGRPGVLERSYPGPFGKGTGAEILQIRVADLLTHGWDLVQATAIPADLPEEVAEQALAFIRIQLANQPRAPRFADPQPIDDTAPAIEQLAAFTGRQVPPRQ